MATALARRSWRELSRRKARAAFTIATIALAVLGLWLFAVPPLMNGAMSERVAQDLLYDLRLTPRGVELTDDQIAEMRRLPNVAGLEARIAIDSKFTAGGASQDVVVFGVADFADQQVNVVLLEDGTMPGPREVLSDPQNDRTGRFDGGIGTPLRIAGHAFTVSGIGSTLQMTVGVDDGGAVVYMRLDDLRRITGIEGYTWIDVRVDDHGPAAVESTVAAITSYLDGVAPGLEYWSPVREREPGTWPEQDDFERVMQIIYFIAVVGLASALFMVFNTMNSIMRERTREIGILKAVGGRRAVILRSYLRTAAYLGLVGTAIGVAAGIPFSNWLVQTTGGSFSGVEPDLGVPPAVLAATVALGILGPMAAAVPAVLRATRMPVREALVDHGVSARFGDGRLDRLLRSARFLPGMARLGLRNAVRRKGRSAATGTQVGIAVGIAIGFLVMGATVLALTKESKEAESADITVVNVAGIDEVLAETPGVARWEAQIIASAGVAGEPHNLWGLPAETEQYAYDLTAGRWFTAEEEAAEARVAVLGPALAGNEGIDVGDAITVEAQDALHTFEVIGVDRYLPDDGNAVFVPITTAAAVTGAVATIYEVETASADEAFIDGVAADLENRLGRYGAAVYVNYIDLAASQTQNRLILSIVIALSLPVVAIGMVGLANTMTTNVLERTREIGILRALGARRRDVGRMVRVEALTLGLLGWVLATPIGYLIGRLLLWLLSRTFHFQVSVVMPLWILPVTLLITLLVATFVTRWPVRQATRLTPGTAIRYE